MTRRASTWMAAVLLTLPLAACGDGDSADETSATTSAGSSATSESPTSEGDEADRIAADLGCESPVEKEVMATERYLECTTEGGEDVSISTFATPDDQDAVIGVASTNTTMTYVEGDLWVVTAPDADKSTLEEIATTTGGTVRTREASNPIELEPPPGD